jgi:hypothetical protein
MTTIFLNYALTKSSKGASQRKSILASYNNVISLLEEENLEPRKQLLRYYNLVFIGFATHVIDVIGQATYVVSQIFN